MKRRILFILWIMAGINAFLIPPLQGETPTSSVQPDCPSCPSFGVQRFQEKKEAPQFSLKCLDGNTIALRDLKGKPVLLKFWATWCPTCKEELPVLEKTLTGKRDQLTILLLAIDGEKDKRVQRCVKESKITLPVLLDPKEKIARTYGVKFIPAAFLVDREGMMIGAIIGERDWSSPAAWSSIKELFCLR